MAITTLSRIQTKKAANITHQNAANACSKKLNIPFLTGDREFKDIENVEFIK